MMVMMKMMMTMTALISLATDEVQWLITGACGELDRRLKTIPLSVGT